MTWTGMQHLARVTRPTNNTSNNQKWGDYLSITNEDNQDFEKYCGAVSSGKIVKVTGRYVNIYFHSNWRINRKGYNLSFSAVPLGQFVNASLENATGCGRVSNNILLSPGYPNNYPDHMNCAYMVNIPHGMAMKIFFKYFNLEDESLCGFDYLSIENNQDFGKYCGARSAESVIVTGRYVNISFHSDGSDNRRGYNVSFSVVPPVGYCSDLDLGMQSGSIPDNRVTASSQLNSNTPAKNGRLNYAAGSSWCASTNDSNPYLQIDLQTLHIICAVSTQGNAKADEWVKTYTLQTSTDGKKWTDYKDGEQVEVLRGNVDSNTTNKNFINLGVSTRWMRFLGTAGHVAFCMRVEVYGVKQKPENIAAGKVTEQSSTYSNNYTNGTSAKAVDGNSDPDFNNGHCSRTLEDSRSWWRVDLGDRVPVFEVRIVNRLVWSSNRSSDLRNRDYKITLGDSPNVTTNPECVGEYSFADFIASAVCYMRDYGIVYFPTGRYVGIMTTTKQFLQLCEVEIYSRDNMAFNKAAEQSRTVGGRSASRAVDGNIYTYSWTGYDNPAWWRVDLGREEHVSAVYIDGVIWGSFDIRVGSVPNVLSGPLCATSRIHFVQTLFCRPTLYGKYVTIIGMEQSRLGLREVEVYSTRRASQIQEVGVTSRHEIPSSSFTASSSRTGNEPDQARLNFRGWLPSTNSNPSDYLQIHLQYVFFICAVATQGNPKADQWTTKYKLLLSLDKTTWITYKENGTEKIFNGNNGRNDVVKHNLVETARASIVRFQPTEYRSHKALRVALYGTIVPAVPYHPPNNLSLTAQTSTSVIASWQRPSKRKITGYKLFYRKQGSQDSLTILTTSRSAATVAKLIKYAKYEFKVLAFNHFGDGPNSSFKVVRTKEDVPSEAPRNLTATARSSTSVVTTWQLPATDSRNGIITGFKLFYKTKGSDINSGTTFLLDSGDSLSKTVFGLDEFTEYEFQVLAFTSVGDGPKSAVVIVRTKEDVPSEAPRDLTATANTSTSIVTAWQLPVADSHNGIIKGFKLFVRRKGSKDSKKSFQVNGTSNLAKTVPGLDKFTEYEFQVLAFTSVGDGPMSAVIVAITKEDVPTQAPSSFKVIAQTSTSVLASWQPLLGDAANGNIVGFKLFYRKLGYNTSQTIQTINSSTSSVSGLEKYTKYEFQVLAFTSVGDGPTSVRQVVRTKEDVPSEAPTGLSATSSTSASIFMAWQPPANDSHNGIIKGFKLFVKRKDSDEAPNTLVVTSVSNPQKNVTGLDDFTEYEFQVLAFTSAGDGMKSPHVVARTKKRKGDGLSLGSILAFLVGGLSLFALLLVLGITFYRKIKRQTKRTAKDIQLLDPAEIPPLRIEIVEELGQGAFGKVSKSKLKDGLDYFVDNKHVVKAKRKEQFVAVKELFGE